MDNDFFMNQSSVATWQTMNDMNWDNPLGHTVVQYESALSSMVSSPVASNSNMTNDCFVIRELIGKLGNINNPGEISPHWRSPVLINSGTPLVSASYIGGSNSANTSCYNTPLNSPPKLSLPIMDQMVRDRITKLGHLAHSMALNSSVAEFSADPGFAERAARFSCFGSRSFNGRTSQLGMSDAELVVRSNSNHLLANTNIRLPRVSSSPSLKALGSQVKLQQNMNSPLQGRVELANSQEESSVSEQIPSLDINARNDMNSRKRKAIPKGKAKETSNPSIAGKVSEMNENPNSKRSKQDGNSGDENSPAKPEEESNKAEEKKPESETKPPEPPKDYIHVRARRGQATDSHSLAERVRREKISERMKLLQDLVPGCSKVTGKALMLDEIINYVQSLQRQVEFLSMKLASVNTSMDFNMDAVIPKDMYQPNSSIGNLMFPADSSTSSFHGQLNQTLHLHGHIPDGTVTPCSLDPLNVSTSGNFDSQLLPLNELQYQKFCGDDLQSIVQMGFSHNLHQETPFHMQTYHGTNQVSNTKIEH